MGLVVWWALGLWRTEVAGLVGLLALGRVVKYKYLLQ